MKFNLLFTMLLSLSEMGKKVANPKADSDNFANFPTDCCGTGEPSCQDSLGAILTGKQIAGNFEGVSIDGVQYAVDPTAPISATDTDAIYEFIYAIVKTFEYNISLNVNFNQDDGTLTVEHIGQCVLNSIVIDGSVLPLERCCELVLNTMYKSFFVDDVELTFDGNVEALGTYAYVVPTDPNDESEQANIDNLATAATAQSEFEAALLAVGINANNVMVEVNNDDEGYTLTYYATGQQAMVDGVNVTNCGTEEAFIC